MAEWLGSRLRHAPQVAANGLTGHLQDDHGGVQYAQCLDGRDVESDDVTCVDTYGRERRPAVTAAPGTTQGHGGSHSPDLTPQDTSVTRRELLPRPSSTHSGPPPEQASPRPASARRLCSTPPPGQARQFPQGPAEGGAEAPEPRGHSTLLSPQPAPPRICGQAGSGPPGRTVCGHRTWVEEPRLQGGLQGHQQLLPLVSPLQAILKVLDGRPGVREVCREKAVLTRARPGVQGSPRLAAAVALTPSLPTCLTTTALQGGQTATPKGPVQRGT